MDRSEYYRQWRLRNKDRQRAYHKTKYELNKAKYIDRAKKAYEKDPEAKKAYHKLYYAKNKAKVMATVELWRLKNINKARQIHADVMNRRRARLKQLESEKYNRLEVYNIFGGFCIVCNDWIDLETKFPHAASFTIHHLIPISKGGSDIIKNVAPAHFGCNILVGNRVPIAMKPRVYNG